MISTLLALATLTASAGDDPWGSAPSEPAPSEPAPSEPAPTEGPPAAGAPVEAAPAEAAPVVALPEAPPAAERSLAGGNVPSGFRISGDAGAGTGVALGQQLLLGRTGGSHATVLSARYDLGKATVAVGVPMAWYRTVGERTTDIGNVQADLWFSREGKRAVRSLGVETHFALGHGAWTWVNRPDDLWPGAGVDIAMQWRTLPGKDWTVMKRVAVGAHGAKPYDPFPSFWIRLNAAAGIDRQIGRRFGAAAELSVQTWDMSPIDLTLLARADLLEGLRVRAAWLAPVGVWAGLSPSGQAGGLTESTFLVDLAFSR